MRGGGKCVPNRPVIRFLHRVSGDFSSVSCLSFSNHRYHEAMMSGGFYVCKVWARHYRSSFVVVFRGGGDARKDTVTIMVRVYSIDGLRWNKLSLMARSIMKTLIRLIIWYKSFPWMPLNVVVRRRRFYRRQRMNKLFG